MRIREGRESIGVGVIGCGHWGMNYLRVLRDMAEVGPVAAIDSRQQRLKEVDTRYPGIAVYESVQDALADPSLDAMVIATPATTHYELVKKCLQEGKSVLVEKPITTNSEQAEELIELADSLDLSLLVGHTFLYNAAVRKVKSYIENGDLGQLYYLYARRTNLGPIREDVNALWDLAAHDISIVHYLLGRPPKWVSAVGAKVLKNGLADVGFFVLGYEDDFVAHVHVSWADPDKVRELVVVGSDSRVVFDDLKIGEQVRIHEKGVTPLASSSGESFGLDLLIRDGDIISPNIEPSEPLKNQCLDFLNSVRTGSRPVSDGAIGVAVVQTLEAIDQSVSLNGAPVDINSSRKLVDLSDQMVGLQP